MATLEDLFAHRDNFRPHAPESETDRCKCPKCGKAMQFSEWGHHDGMDSGVWCEECNDFHSCFECPSCGGLIGAAGYFSGWIEVETESA